MQFVKWPEDSSSAAIIAKQETVLFSLIHFQQVAKLQKLSADLHFFECLGNMDKTSTSKVAKLEQSEKKKLEQEQEQEKGQDQEQEQE